MPIDSQTTQTCTGIQIIKNLEGVQLLIDSYLNDLFNLNCKFLIGGNLSKFK